ncbi:MAG TPA: hypothetical protein VG753_00855 [Candidatus Paceibacterota bacterium]|nr:hypothetical protein [Candidatus Paceibacterota bacterium]
MTLFFTITLAVSLLGLILMLAVKRREMRTGRVIFARLRPKHGGLLHSVVYFFERTLPVTIKYLVFRASEGVGAIIKRTFARAILLFEYALEHMLVFIRDLTRPPQKGGPASPFLQEVADHKRELMKGSQEDHAIFEE